MIRTGPEQLSRPAGNAQLFITTPENPHLRHFAKDGGYSLTIDSVPVFGDP